MRSQIDFEVYSDVKELTAGERQLVNEWPEKPEGILRISFQIKDLAVDENIADVLEYASLFVKDFFQGRGFFITEKRTEQRGELTALVCGTDYNELIQSLNRKKWGMKANYRYSLQQGYLNWMRERDCYMSHIRFVEKQKWLENRIRSVLMVAVLLFAVVPNEILYFVNSLEIRLLVSLCIVILAWALERFDLPGGLKLRKKGTQIQ